MRRIRGTGTGSDIPSVPGIVAQQVSREAFVHDIDVSPGRSRIALPEICFCICPCYQCSQVAPIEHPDNQLRHA